MVRLERCGSKDTKFQLDWRNNSAEQLCVIMTKLVTIYYILKDWENSKIEAGMRNVWPARCLKPQIHFVGLAKTSTSKI